MNEKSFNHGQGNSQQIKIQFFATPTFELPIKPMKATTFPPGTTGLPSLFQLVAQAEEFTPDLAAKVIMHLGGMSITELMLHPEKLAAVIAAVQSRRLPRTVRTATSGGKAPARPPAPLRPTA